MGDVVVPPFLGAKLDDDTDLGTRIIHGQPADPPLVSDSKGILWHVSSR